MASENLELVRSICSEWERGDYRTTEWQHPDIEFVIADGPEAGSWRGAAGIAEGWGAFLGAWDEFHTEVDEYRELDGDRVLILARFGGRGKASGLAVDTLGSDAAGVFHIRGGKVTKLVMYFDRRNAFDDVGAA